MSKAKQKQKQKGLYAQFILDNNRIPLMEKGEKPWEYRGWLLWHVQQVDMHLHGPESRWNYHFAMQSWLNPDFHAEGFRAKDPGPIPRMNFTTPHADAQKNLRDAYTQFAYKSEGWGSFTDFVKAIAFGLDADSATENPDVPDKALEVLYRVLNLGLWLKQPYDYLGAFICDGRGSRAWNPNAFYPTPHPVCEAMVAMAMSDASHDTRFDSVQDPCVGTGRLLLHASNYSLDLYGQDIDPLMVLITKIHGAVYAPWICWPLPKDQVAKKRLNARRTIIFPEHMAYEFDTTTQQAKPSKSYEAKTGPSVLGAKDVIDLSALLEE